MQKIGTLEKWRTLTPSAAIEFPVATPVRLEVTTPPDTEWYYILKGSKSEPQFLTTTTGHDVLTFAPSAGLKLQPSAKCRYLMAQDQIVHREGDGSSFATIANRQQRNPELEAMMRQMNKNNERRMAQMFYEQERRHALEREMTQYDPETGEVIERRSSGSQVVEPPLSSDRSDDTVHTPGISPQVQPSPAENGGEGSELPNGDAPANKQTVSENA